MRQAFYFFLGLFLIVAVTGCATPTTATPTTAFGYTKKPVAGKQKKKKEKVSITEIAVDAAIDGVAEKAAEKNGQPKAKPPGIL